MACRMCEDRTPEDMAWFTGAQPKCAFGEGAFNPDNWNCATAGAIRNICGAYDRNDLPEGVCRTWDEDQNYATILIPMYVERPDGRHFGSILYVEWYKSRGCTEEMWLLGVKPRVPTEKECLAIIAYYQNRELRPNGHPDDDDLTGAVR